MNFHIKGFPAGLAGECYRLFRSGEWVHGAHWRLDKYDSPIDWKEVIESGEVVDAYLTGKIREMKTHRAEVRIALRKATARLEEQEEASVAMREIDEERRGRFCNESRV